MGKKKARAGQRNRTVTVGGSLTGQVVAGDGNTLINTGTIGGPPVSSEELSELRQTIEALKAQVLAQVPPEKRSAAVERLDELHEAITADKPKLSTMEYVRDWFASNIPTMAGAVTAVVINPIVGRLVQAGGDALVSEFERRFG